MIAVDNAVRPSSRPATLDPPPSDAGKSPLDAALDLLKVATTPVAAGEALRAIDALVGRSGTVALASGDTAPSRLDGARETGRGSVRPHLGDGPATPGTITHGTGVPGFPNPPAAPATGDGSGAHGTQSPSLGDRAFEQVAFRAADAADAIGLNNAARNMRHYLSNTGSTLGVDPARMKADLPAISRAMDASFNAQVRDVALAQVRANYDGKPMSFQITTPWNGAYATKGMSQDWFYAIGGFSFAHTANVTVTPGPNGSAQVHIDSQLHVFDRYNWDGGKAVTIGPITVTDAQMGRLHTVGLAREFEVRGSSNGPSLNLSVPRDQLAK